MKGKKEQQQQKKTNRKTPKKRKNDQAWKNYLSFILFFICTQASLPLTFRFSYLSLLRKGQTPSTQVRCIMNDMCQPLHNILQAYFLFLGGVETTSMNPVQQYPVFVFEGDKKRTTTLSIKYIGFQSCNFSYSVRIISLGSLIIEAV